MHCRCTNHIIL